MKLPLEFYAIAKSAPGVQSVWTIESSNHLAQCAIPPEFNGPGGGLSPEDLFVQALTNCFVATFKVYAENSKLVFDDIGIESRLSVDLNENKKTVMKSCHFNIKIKNSNNTDKAKTLIQKAFQSGFILNSVNTQLSYDLILS